MLAQVECPCGERISVSTGGAGSVVECRCGRSLTVPSLSELQSCARAGRAAAARPVPPAAAAKINAEESSPRDFVMVLTADDSLHERISGEAFSHFVSALNREIKEFEKMHSEAGMDIQAAVAILPDKKRLIDFQLYPSDVPAEVVASLESTLEELAVPDVLGGPVSFAFRCMLWGGSATLPEFDFPFAKFFRGRSGQIDELLMEIAGLHDKASDTSGAREPDPSAGQSHEQPGPDTRSWWVRLKDRLGRTTSQHGSAGQRLPEGIDVPQGLPSDSPPPPDTEVGGGEMSLEDLDRLIKQQPEDANLFGLRADLLRSSGEFERAIEDYTELIRLQPHDAHSFVNRGHTYCLAGQMKHGLVDFSKAIELDPHQVDGLNARGMVYLELEGWDNAISDFSRASGIVGGRSPSIRINRARAYLAKGDVEAALAECDVALHLDPHDEDAYALRAFARVQKEDGDAAAVIAIESALEDLDAAIKINSEQVGYYVRRAELYSSQGHERQSILDCDHALRIDPDCIPAFAVRGIAKQQLGASEEAIADCTKAIDGGVASENVYFARAAAHHAEGENDLAFGDCQSVIEFDAKNASAYNMRGLIQLDRDSVEEALADFDTAIELAPEWAVPYGNRGNAYRMREDHQLAIRDYDRAIELDATLAGAYLNRAATYANDRKFEKAIADFAKGLHLEPDFAPGYFGRAIFWIEREEYEKAIADFDKVIELDPDCAPAYYNRGNLSAQLGHHDAAVRDFDRLIRMCPTLGAAYSGRGNVWIQKGEHDKAAADYRDAIECDPGAAEAYIIQRLVVEAAHLHQQEDFDGAISKANDAIELDAGCGPAYALRAAAYWYSGQFVEAIDDFTLLLDNAGESFAAHSGRGQVYAELGEFDLAMEDLNRALELGKDEETTTNLAYAYSGRALANAGLGHYSEASHDFDRSIQDCPENAWVHYNHGLMYDKLAESEKAAICFELALELNEPPLTPRKRDKARAYLTRVTGPAPGRTDANT